ncbi:MAG: flagellar biosynthesis regulator FlaF [Syntrophales bacterium]|nr:flagellar biosynthesis regulator FlaF [Syntrophales bacterium]
MYNNLARQRGIGAYQGVQKTTMTGREIEASVLTKGALLLKQCQDTWGSNGLSADLDSALKFNQIVWSILQNELSKEDNPLPLKLRQEILSLSIFIDRRIFEVMAHPSPEKLTIIININSTLAAGLRGSPGA